MNQADPVFSLGPGVVLSKRDGLSRRCLGPGHSDSLVVDRSDPWGYPADFTLACVREYRALFTGDSVLSRASRLWIGRPHAEGARPCGQAGAVKQLVYWYAFYGAPLMSRPLTRRHGGTAAYEPLGLERAGLGSSPALDHE